jgi:segregation and condensation protein B
MDEDYTTENPTEVTTEKSSDVDNVSDLKSRVESVLFWKAEPMKISELAKILEVKDKKIKVAVEELGEALVGRGVSLVMHQDSVALVSAPSSAEIIEKLQKEELTKDLSKAALETLSIILYRGPIKRSQIDFIRGVNSQFTIRALLVRGLIEKSIDKKDERAYVYSPTIETLAHMGVSKVTDLPDYDSVNTDIDNFINNATED